MAFNGTGTFVRLYNWVTDKNNSIAITASKMDDETDGIATGLTNCITKDGQTVITQNIPFNSKKITGLAVGTARTDAINVGQVQDSQFTYLGTTGGAADAYTASPSPAITAYVASMAYSAKISATNLTTTPTLLISAISGGTIKKLNAAKAEIAVEASDMRTDGWYNFKRNVANDAWILLNPERQYLNNAATETYAGVVELATNAEAIAVSSTTVAVTPAGLGAWAAANDYVSSAQTITASAQTVLAHGLGAQPKSVSLWLENVTASIGYTTGQQVLINPAMNDSSDTTRSRAFSVIADATNITVRTPTDTAIIICNASSGASGAIVAANWKFVIKAKK